MPIPAPARAAALLVALAASAPMLSPTAARAACADADRAPTSAADLPAAQAAVLCLVNEERARRGRGALVADERLARASADHAADMVERGYFSHTSPGGTGLLDRVRRVGWPPRTGGWSCGEILAWGTRSGARPRAIVRGWLRSPGHRAIMLHRAMREIGIGSAFGSPERPGQPGMTVGAVLGRTWS